MILLLLSAGKMQETRGISASGSFSIFPLSRMGRVDFSLFSHGLAPVSYVAKAIRVLACFTCIKMTFCKLETD